MSRIPRAPKTARVSARAYPHGYILTARSAEDAEVIAARILSVGMGAAELRRSGRTLTFRTAEPLDLPENGGRPGVSRDAIVRLSHAFDADLRPEVVYQTVVETQGGRMSWHPYVSRDEAVRELPEKMRLPIEGIIPGTWAVVQMPRGSSPLGAAPSLGDESARPQGDDPEERTLVHPRTGEEAWVRFEAGQPVDAYVSRDVRVDREPSWSPGHNPAFLHASDPPAALAWLRSAGFIDLPEFIDAPDDPQAAPVLAPLGAAIQRLASALRRAASHHGRPNTFGPRELEEYGGPPAMLAGRIGKRLDLMQEVWQLLGGSRGWGSCPRYAGRRFAV